MNISRYRFSARSIVRKAIINIVAAVAFLIYAGACTAQITVFTYQGRMTEASIPATGTYDFQFALYDSAGTLITSPGPIVRTGVAVTNGAFVVQLDFGTAGFPSADRYLEVRVKRPSDPSYIALTPRQRITTTPYAIRANNSTFADFATLASSAQSATSATSATTATTATTAGNVTGVVAIANGGTGSSTKNFVDTSTDQFVGGTKTFSSIAGNGINLTGVVQAAGFGSNFSLMPLTLSWTWLGTPASIQVNSGQRVTISASTDIKTDSNFGGLYQFDICRQSTGLITPFHSTLSFPVPQPGPVVRTYYYSDSLAPDTYLIGLCGISSTNTSPPGVYGLSMGWVMVTR